MLIQDFWTPGRKFWHQHCRLCASDKYEVSSRKSLSSFFSSSRTTLPLLAHTFHIFKLNLKQNFSHKSSLKLVFNNHRFTTTYLFTSLPSSQNNSFQLMCCVIISNLLPTGSDSLPTYFPAEDDKRKAWVVFKLKNLDGLCTHCSLLQCSISGFWEARWCGKSLQRKLILVLAFAKDSPQPNVHVMHFQLGTFFSS